MRGADGRLWTPNGRHRLAAAKVLGLKQITALVSPDEALAFRILALNTEKAHNLKDRSLEVIRMARELARRDKTAKESDFAAEFEDAALLTLGLCYLDERPLRRRRLPPVPAQGRPLQQQGAGAQPARARGLRARLLAIDAEVKRIIGDLQKRGFKSPYLRTYVVARINPVRFHRAKKGDTSPPMPLAARPDADGRRGAQVRRRVRARARPGAGRRRRQRRVVACVVPIAAGRFTWRAPRRGAVAARSAAHPMSAVDANPGTHGLGLGWRLINLNHPSPSPSPSPSP